MKLVEGSNIESFNSQPTLEGHTLKLRPLQVEDFDELYASSSNPKTWAGHPNSDRYQLPVFEKLFKASIESESTLVVISRDENKVIGSSRYYQVTPHPNDLCVGFTFLDCEYWGGKTNRELKGLMLGHAFTAVDTVWLHIAASNIRSRKAAEKIGAVYTGDEELTIGGSTKSNCCYQIEKSLWLASNKDQVLDSL